MSVTLEQLLTLAGRLEDGAGFDAPRERFRRFLGEYIDDAATSRALIEQAQNAPGEQYQRALQDLVVDLGRQLQFDVEFGAANPATGITPYQGLWLSARAVIVVDVRSSRSAASVVDGLARAVATARDTVPQGTTVAGVTVLTPLALSRKKVDDAIAAAADGVVLHAMPMASLLSLVDLVAGGYVTHGDIVRILAGHVPVDFLVGVIDRAVAKAAAAPLPGAVPVPGAASPNDEAVVAATPAVSDGPVVQAAGGAGAPSRCWLVSVAPEHATPPDEFLESVVLRRQMFGISLAGAPDGEVRVGDRLCFYLDFRGVVGHASVDAILDGGGGLREARHFRQVLHVDRVTLDVRAPRRLDADTETRLHAIAPVRGRRGQTLLELSRATFDALTAHESLGANDLGVPAAPAPDTVTSEQDERLTG